MGRVSNAVMWTVSAVVGRLFVQCAGDNFDDLLGSVFLIARNVGISKFFRLADSDERGRSVFTVEAEHWLLIGAAKVERGCRGLLGFRQVCNEMHNLLRVAVVCVAVSCDALACVRAFGRGRVARIAMLGTA